MARIWQCGFELNSLAADVELTTTTGTVTIQTGGVHHRSGTYGLQILNATGQVIKILAASDQSAVAFQRAYFYFDVLPTVDTSIMRFVNSANAVSAGHIRFIAASGKLRLVNSSGSAIGSDSTLVLTTGLEYIVELGVDSTTATGTLTGRVGLDDGSTPTQFATGNNNIRGLWARLAVGNVTATTVTMYVDDLAVNDASGSNQNSWCGHGKIIHQKPAGVGDANAWTRGGTDSGANWSQVDEVTPNDITDYVQSIVLNQEDLYAVEASGIGAGDIVNVVMVGVRFRSTSGAGTSHFKVEIEKATGGTKSQSADIIPSATSWKTNDLAAPFAYPIILYNDPDSNPWTQATLNTAEIGVLEDLAGVGTIEVSTIWMSVDYTPSSGPTVAQEIPSLTQGIEASGMVGRVYA